VNVAFHFNSDALEYGGYYGPPINEKVFRILLSRSFGELHVKVFIGDLLVFGDLKTAEDHARIFSGLVGFGSPSWANIDIDRFANALIETTIYVVLLEGITVRVRDYLVENLSADETYLGAIEVYGANPFHWKYYQQSLIPYGRFVNRQLRLFYSMGNDDGKDTEMAKHFRSSLALDSVDWEDLGARHTIFDDFTSFVHAKRLEGLRGLLSDHMAQIADQILLRLGDLDAKLHDSLYSAFERFTSIETSDDIAQVALSCRRFLERFADVLFPPRAELFKGRKVGPAQHRNRLWAYIDEKTSSPGVVWVIASLDDLGTRIDRLSEQANKGLHGEISSIEVHRLLLALIAVTHDVLSLSPPPESVPQTPFESNLNQFFADFLGQMGREPSDENT
jgi:hypothetical protein